MTDHSGPAEHLGDAAIKSLVPNDTPAPLRDQPGNATAIFQSGLNGLTARASGIGCSALQLAHIIAVAGEQYEKGQALCESPIERMVLAVLIVAKWPDFLTIPPLVHDCRKDAALPDGDLIIAPQMTFGRCRLDLGLIVEWDGARHLMAIECDGSDYHAYRSDQDRDIYLASWGVPVFRLHGNDIYRDGHGVLERVLWRICEWREAKLTDLRAVAHRGIRR